MMRGFGPRKPKQQRQKERKPIPFLRVSAEIMVESTKTIAESRVFLNDMSPTGVGCFTNVAIDKGETVSLVIEQPKHLFVKGEIMWCSPYTLSTKILTQAEFKYRVGIKFCFDSDEEKAALKKFCEDLYSEQGVG
ncbi:MAG: PilZ domain-containing protein [Deltaproteobacteria bacterium]|nr:PilZ domain-containing protein [Deltaproteobacteria bacterium]